MQQRTITAAQMRGINRSAILEIIRRESPVARTTIAKNYNISLPTVMRIVDELIKDGLVSALKERLNGAAGGGVPC